MSDTKKERKTKLNGGDRERVIKALLKTRGIKNKACKLLDVDRNTLSKYLNTHPKALEEYKETVLESFQDDCISNVILLADGKVIHEKTVYDKDGNEQLVYCRMPPNLMANMKLLEIYGRYTPKKVIDHNVKPFDLDLAGKKMKAYGEE